MKISMQTMALDSFVPMLTGLADILDKAAQHAASRRIDLPNARLAPDMYTLTQQVQLACDYARNGTARLTGRRTSAAKNGEKSLTDLKTRVVATIAALKRVKPEAFVGAEKRNCSIKLSPELTIEMDGLQFLRSWILPHFYFHLVTAYDILRHNGVAIGKQDYLAQISSFIRPAGSRKSGRRAR